MPRLPRFSIRRARAGLLSFALLAAPGGVGEADAAEPSLRTPAPAGKRPLFAPAVRKGPQGYLAAVPETAEKPTDPVVTITIKPDGSPTATPGAPPAQTQTAMPPVLPLPPPGARPVTKAEAEGLIDRAVSGLKDIFSPKKRDTVETKGSAFFPAQPVGTLPGGRRLFENVPASGGKKGGAGKEAKGIPEYTEYRNYRKDFEEASEALDNIAGDLEEYGAVTMSMPLLAAPTTTLAFDLQTTADVYYENAKNEVSGRAMAATIILQSLSADLQGAADLGLMATAKTVLGSTLQENVNYQELLQTKAKRADLALRNGLREAERETDVAKREQKTLAAYKARDDILSENTNALRPPSQSNGNNGVANQANFAPALPGSAAVTDPKPATTTPPATPAPASELTRIDRRLLDLADKIDEATIRQNDAAFPGVKKVAEPGSSDVAKTPADAAKNKYNSRMSIGDVDAVRIAESAKSIQGLMNFFHHPVEADAFKDKKVLMGAVTVSITPGWRTRKDFSGEVSVRTSYSWEEAQRGTVERMVGDEKLPLRLRERLAWDYQILDIVTPYKHTVRIDDIPGPLRRNEGADEGLYPNVAGISPLSHSETLDLTSEWKRQDEFALALAVALKGGGYNAQAKVFQQYVKSQRKDVQTRSVSAAVSSYSNGGAIIGFQIGPRLKALEDPASRKNRSANVLERQSFPALLVFGLEGRDIYPRMQVVEGGRLAAYEPQIMLNQKTHWNPLSYKFAGPNQWFNPLKAWPPYWQPAFTEKKRTERLLDWNEAKLDLKRQSPNWPYEKEKFLGGITADLQERFKHIAGRAYGVTATTGIPAEICVPYSSVGQVKKARPGTPLIRAVAPPEINIQAEKRPVAEQQEDIVEAVKLYDDAAVTYDFYNAEVALFLAPAIAKIHELLKEPKLTTFANGRDNGKNADGTAKPAPADQKKQDEAWLMDTSLYLRRLQLAYNTAATATAALTLVVRDEQRTEDKLKARPGAVRRALLGVPGPLGGKLPMDAGYLTRLKAELVDLERGKERVLDATKEADKLEIIGHRLLGLLKPDGTLPDVIIAFLGENLGELRRVECALGHDVLDWAQPSELPGLETTTYAQERMILMRIRPTASTVVPFRLTFVQPPEVPGGMPIVTTLYTPPVVINVAGTTPVMPAGLPHTDATPPAPVFPFDAPIRRVAEEPPTRRTPAVASRPRAEGAGKPFEPGLELFPLPNEP